MVLHYAGRLAFANRPASFRVTAFVLTGSLFRELAAVTAVSKVDE